MTISHSGIEAIIEQTTDTALKNIAIKVKNKERINQTEGILLFEKGELGFLGSLANYIAQDLHQNKV